MTEAGKMVRSAGSQITGAFKGLWGKQGKGGSQTAPEPSGLPEGTRVAHSEPEQPAPGPVQPDTVPTDAPEA